jgi:hypothetical protein
VSAEELKLYQTRIITVMDNDDDFRVHAFPVNETITFEWREKEVLKTAKRGLELCRYIFVCTAIAEPMHAIAPPIVDRVVRKIKLLISEGAMAVGIEEDRAEDEFKSLEALTAEYWRTEPTLRILGFVRGDIHRTRIAWLEHLLKYY